MAGIGGDGVEPPPGHQERLADDVVRDVPAGPADRVRIDLAMMPAEDHREPVMRRRWCHSRCSFAKGEPSRGNDRRTAILTDTRENPGGSRPSNDVTTWSPAAG